MPMWPILFLLTSLYVFFDETIAIVLGVPILILLDSKKRLKKFSWEWAVVSYLAMSIYMSLLNDTIFPQWFTGTTFLVAFSRGNLSMFGPFAFWSLYKAIEYPIQQKGRKWLRLRLVGSLLILIGIMGTYVFILIKTTQFYLVSGVFIGGSLIFIIGQIGMLSHREQGYTRLIDNIKKKGGLMTEFAIIAFICVSFLTIPFSARSVPSKFVKEFLEILANDGDKEITKYTNSTVVDQDDYYIDYIARLKSGGGLKEVIIYDVNQEYNSYNVTFKIQMNNGNEFEGFVFVNKKSGNWKISMFWIPPERK